MPLLMCLYIIDRDTPEDVKIPFIVGGSMGGVILLLLFMTVILIIAVLIFRRQSARDKNKNRTSDSVLPSNHHVGFNG